MAIDPAKRKKQRTPFKSQGWLATSLPGLPRSKDIPIMPHPEVDSRNPFGYSVHWQVAHDRPTPFPWLKLTAVAIGASMLCFAGGYFLATNQTASQVKDAEALKAEAQQIKAAATGDLDIARAKVAEQQQRLRIVNDCVYSALNEPVPTPIPSPAQ